MPAGFKIRVLISLVALACGSAFGATVTYDFSGVVGLSSIPDIRPGAAVQFSLAYDETWPSLGMPHLNAVEFQIPLDPSVVVGTISGMRFQAQTGGRAILVLNASVGEPLFTCQSCDLLQMLVGFDAHQAVISFVDVDRSNGLTLALPNPLPVTGWEFIDFQFFNADTSQFADALVHVVPEASSWWLVFAPLFIALVTFRRRCYLRAGQRRSARRSAG